MNEKNLKITMGMVVFFFCSVASLVLLFILNPTVIDFFTLSFYTKLLSVNLLPLLLMLFFMGISVTSLVMAVKQFPIEKALVIAGVSMAAVALLALLVFGSTPLTLTIAVFAVLGVLFVLVLPGVLPSGYWSAFSQGWHTMGKIFFFLALGALFGSLFMVSSHPDQYEDAFKDVLKSFVQEQGNFELSRDQIRGLLEAQIESADLSMTKEEIRAMLESSYIEPTVDDYIALTYPQFDTYPKDMQQQIRTEVTELLASEEYQQQVEESLDKQTEAYYLQVNDPLAQEKQRQKLKQNLDAQVEAQYQRFQQLNNNNVFAQQADLLFESLPLFQQLLNILPFLVGFTLLSIILFLGNLASFGGAVTLMAYHFWQPSSPSKPEPNNPEEKASENEPNPSKKK